MCGQNHNLVEIRVLLLGSISGKGKPLSPKVAYAFT